MKQKVFYKMNQPYFSDQMAQVNPKITLDSDSKQLCISNTDRPSLFSDCIMQNTSWVA